MDETFYSRFNFDKCTIVCQTNNFTVNFCSNGKFFFNKPEDLEINKGNFTQRVTWHRQFFYRVQMDFPMEAKNVIGYAIKDDNVVFRSGMNDRDDRELAWSRLLDFYCNIPNKHNLFKKLVKNHLILKSAF